MKFDRMRLFCGTCLAVVLLFDSASVFAKDSKESQPPVKLTTDLKAQVTSSNNMDLDTDDEGGSDNQLLELKSKLEGRVGGNVSFLLEARGVKNYGEGGAIDTDTGEATGRDDFLELRQYWVGYDSLFGQDSLSVRAGRQRIREDYGFWWNRDLDALRAFYDTESLKGFVGIGEDLSEYRTSGDSFNQDDEAVFRAFGEISKEWKPNSFAEGRFMYQDDHSGIEDVGDLVKANDYDAADADLLWMGLRFRGTSEQIESKEKRITVPTYRVDLVTVVGEEDDLNSSAGPGAFRTVTGSDNEDVFGWAFDAGIDIPVALSMKPVFHAGYAYGSGDDDSTDGTDHAFRGTGLDGNSSKLGGFSSTVNNYGSVLRPDLSNLHIATLGLSIPLAEATDIGGFYHYYRLAEKDGAITSSITAPLNGDDADLGHGLDVILNMNVAKQFSIEQSMLDRINFKTTLGAFRAGEAYGDASGETALRGQVDFSLRF